MASFRITRPNKKVLSPKGVQEELLTYIATTGPSAVYGTHTALNRSLSSIQTAMKRLDDMNLVTFSGTDAGERGQTRRLFSLTLQGFCIMLLGIERQKNEGTLSDDSAEKIIDTLLTQWGNTTPVTAEWETLLFRIESENPISGERIRAECVEWFCTSAAFTARAVDKTRTGVKTKTDDKTNDETHEINIFTDTFCKELIRATKNPRNKEWISVLMTIAAEEMPVFYAVVDVAVTTEIDRLLSEAKGLGHFLVAQP